MLDVNPAPFLESSDFLLKCKGERVMTTKAEVGNIIEFKNGLRGIVEKVNENSVIVDLTYMENFKELDLEEKTVVNHKNYKIVSK
jgi:uncharacterized protein YkvS